MSKKTTVDEVKLAESKKRSRKKTEFYGASENFLNDSIDDSVLQELEDDSFEDKNYSPEENGKVVATVKRARNSDHSPNQPGSANRKHQFGSNYDDLFDDIDSVSLQKTAVHTIDVQSTVFNSDIATENIQTSSNVVNVAKEKPHENSHTHDRTSTHICSCAKNNRDTLELFNKINDKLDNLVSRVSLLESTLLRNVANTSNRSNSENVKNIEQLDIFMKSNCLPTTNIDELANFEKKLADSAFFNASVSMRVIRILSLWPWSMGSLNKHILIVISCFDTVQKPM